MRSEFDPAELAQADAQAADGGGEAASPVNLRKGKGKGAAAKAKAKGGGGGDDDGGALQQQGGAGRGKGRWDYTGWEEWLKLEEDVNDPKDIANAKSRMRKAAAKTAFKAKKGTKWLSLI